jgi:hypothetical protein
VLLIPAAWILFASMEGHAMEHAPILLIPTWMTLPVLRLGPVVLRPVPLLMIAMVAALVMYTGRCWADQDAILESGMRRGVPINPV